MITESIDIDRTPEDVFVYVDQLDRHGEWQDAIVSARKEPQGPTHIGTRNIEIRRVPGGPREFTSEIFEYDPPRRISARGVKTPFESRVTIAVEPIGDGSRSRVTHELDLVGRGIGRLFVILALRGARKEFPRNLARLKERLESESNRE